jgi:hypothetical protein
VEDQWVIVTSMKPYGVIKGMLKKWKKHGVIACNSCARHCETGGKAKMEELAERLKQDGYEIVEAEVVPMVCNLAHEKKPEYDGDILVVLACDAGVFTLQTLFPTKIIVPALNTLGVGARDGTEGSIFLMVKF